MSTKLTEVRFGKAWHAYCVVAGGLSIGMASLALFGGFSTVSHLHLAESPTLDASRLT